MQLIRITKQKNDIHKEGKKYGNLQNYFSVLVRNKLKEVVLCDKAQFTVTQYTFQITSESEITLDIFLLAAKYEKIITIT